MKQATIRYPNVLSSVFGLVLFLLSVWPHLVPLSIVFLAVTIFTGYYKKELYFHFNVINSLCIALYLAYVFGAFFSDFPETAGKYLEYKLSLVVFPLLMMFRIKGGFPLQNTFIGFILGCIVGAITGLFHGYSCYESSGSFSCFLSSSVSTIIHPTYFSVYTTLAIVCVWTGYTRKYLFFSLPVCILITLFLSIYTVFMMSLTGMLFLGMMLFAVAAVIIFRKWKWMGLTGLILLSPAVAFFSYKTVPQVKHEVDDVLYYGERYLDHSDNYFESLYYPYSGTESRLIMWRISLEQFRETPWGLGTGNVDHALQKRMKGKLDDEFVARNLNSHNQFLQTGLEVGITGLLILVALMIAGFVKAVRDKNTLLLAVIASFSFNCLFESMLQRQSGVVFYTVMICLLVIPNSFFKNESE